MFYFNWIEEDEIFNSDVHQQQAIDIFDLIITEAETVYPTAIITVAATQQLWQQLREHNWAMIAYDDGQQRIPLFKGYVNSFPISFNGSTVKLEFIAKPSNAAKRLENLRTQLIHDTTYDLMLFSHLYDINQADLSDLLTQHCKLIYWDRITNAVQLTSYTSEHTPLKFVDRHFANSLDIVAHRTPLKSIDITININWTQQYQGETCLDPILQHYFKDGTIDTLTGDDFKQRWWQNFERIGYSGYEVKRTTLTEVKPAIARHQSRTRPILVSNKDPLLMKQRISQPKRIRLKKYSYRPSMTVRWRYHQQRGEQLFFQVRQNLQGAGASRAGHKQLVVNLPQPAYSRDVIDWSPELIFKRGDYCRFDQSIYLCVMTHRTADHFAENQVNWIKVPGPAALNINQQIGVFFSTEQGQKIINLVTQQAAVILQASRRCIDIKFCCSLHDAMHLSTHQTIEIHDNQLPHGQAIGKVKKLVLHACGATGQYLAYVTIGCSLGTFDIKDSKSEIEDDIALFTPDVIEHDAPDLMVVDDQNIVEGLLFPQYLSASDLLKNVEVINDATIQEKEILAQQFPFGHNLEYVLNKHCTQVKLELEDIKSLPRLKRSIKLSPKYCAARAAQIIL